VIARSTWGSFLY